jgi:hypothetical protein
MELKGEKLAELIDGRSLVFNKARWLTEAATVISKGRGKSCGLKMFLSQRTRLVTWKPLDTNLVD